MLMELGGDDCAKKRSSVLGVRIGLVYNVLGVLMVLLVLLDGTATQERAQYEYRDLRPMRSLFV